MKRLDLPKFVAFSMQEGDGEWQFFALAENGRFWRGVYGWQGTLEWAPIPELGRVERGGGSTPERSD